MLRHTSLLYKQSVRTSDDADYFPKLIVNVSEASAIPRMQFQVAPLQLRAHKRRAYAMDAAAPAPAPAKRPRLHALNESIAQMSVSPTPAPSSPASEKASCEVRDVSLAERDERPVPWWLARRGADRKKGARSETECYYCEGARGDDGVERKCGRCEHWICVTCARECEACCACRCSCCTIVDYDASVERTLCVECFDSDVCFSSREPRVECDGDHLMSGG